MSNQRAIVQLVKDISGQSNVLAIPRIFIRMTGDVKAALFLSQCVYWSDKSKREDGYFYKTAGEWEDEIGLSRHELDGARKKTSASIQTKLVKANGVPTLHYRADIEAITDWIEAFYTEQANGIDENRQTGLPESDKSGLPKSDKSLTETTHRLSTETSNKEVVEEPEPQRPNIYSVYEAEIGALTPMLGELLDDIEKTYPDGWFVEAVKEAKKSTTRVSLKYVEAIMRRWKADGKPVPHAEKGAVLPEHFTVELPAFLEVGR